MQKRTKEQQKHVNFKPIKVQASKSESFLADRPGYYMEQFCADEQLEQFPTTLHCCSKSCGQKLSPDTLDPKFLLH